MAVENKKSLKLNMVLNMLRGFLGAVFPLITFPYVTRVLGVENIGMFNFANSVVSYFVLLAGLGINTYAIREGSHLREDRGKLEKFLAEVFSINILSTMVAYVLMIAIIMTAPQLRSYTTLILILSSQIAFKTIGVEWLYTIYEEYAYITIRTIIFQFISLILMFLLVRKPSDVAMYAIATVMATVGSNLLNFVHAKKYCRLSVKWKINWKKHFKSIMILFATAVTVTVYVSSDTTILGLICGDYEIGIYTVSVKVYTVLKTVFSSAIVVAIPRMAKLAGENSMLEFAKLGNYIYKTFISFIFPAILGVIILREQIVLILSGPDYITAQSSLALLSVALFFCLGAGFWSQAVMIPLNMENRVFGITVVSAVVNIVLNFFTVSIWQENAAALTTVIAECLVFIYCWYQSRGQIDMQGVFKTILKSFLGCLPMVAIAYFVRLIFSNIIIVTVFTVVFCVVEYTTVELILKNEIIGGCVSSIKQKLKYN